MLILMWISLFFSMFSVIKGHPDDLYREFTMSEEGRADIQGLFQEKLFKKNLFLTEDDLELNIKDHILPWKSSSDRTELKKRRVFRNIVNRVKSDYMHGWKLGSLQRNMDWAVEEGDDNGKKGINALTGLRFEHTDNKWGVGNAKRVWIVSSTRKAAKDMGIKDGWILESVNDIAMLDTQRSSFSEAIEETKEDKTRRMTFLAPKYSDLDADSIDEMSLSEFELLLNMDFLKLSDKFEAKKEL